MTHIQGLTFDQATSKKTEILIYTLEDLYNIRNDLTATYRLMNNLDFQNDNDYADTNNKSAYTTGSGWLPIGDSTNKFTGNLKGNNFVIRNLFINRPTTVDQALFGFAGEGAIFTDITLLDVNITGGNATAALLAENAEINLLVKNCHSSGNITGKYYAGGLIGSLNFNSANNGNTIRECSSSCTVNGTWFAGGLIGVCRHTVIDCYATGDITAQYHAGGLTGFADNSAKMVNCYSTGHVTNTAGSGYGGGLIGYNDTSGNAFWDSTNCFWDTETSGYTTSKGPEVGKTTTEMKTAATFANWDSANIWNIYGTDGVTYPSLKLSRPPLPTLDKLIAWYDASDISTITLNGSKVSQWKDKSGHSGHLIQTTEANQPTYATNQVNGLNVVQFPEAIDTSMIGATYTHDTFTCYIVAKGTAEHQLTTEHNSSVADWGNDSRALLNMYPGSPLINSTPTYGGQMVSLANNGIATLESITNYYSASCVINQTLTTEKVFTIETTSTHANASINNGSIHTGLNYGPANVSGDVIDQVASFIRIGGYVSGPSNTWFAGNACEILVFKGSHDAATRTAFYNYLSTKWGIT